MSRRLRAFLSSTMRDLANERDAIVRSLGALNLEVVNAEGWLPTGAKSWPRIQNELASSDIMLLLLGERYGWIPPNGPGAAEQLAVTHLEYDEGRRLGLPVLPFAKRLAYHTPRDTEDARRRDAFRSQVLDWAGGQFAAEFDLASDLAESVGKAVVGMLSDEYLRQTIVQRREGVDAQVARIVPASGLPSEAPVTLPEQLVAQVKSGEAILFAGSGISLAAGLPSAAAFVEHFRSLVDPTVRGLDPRTAAAQFATAAADVEAVFGRDVLAAQLGRLLDPPQGLTPTSAHVAAIHLFRTIVTTNFDTLFESAASQAGGGWSVLNGPNDVSDGEKAIIKLHGSWNDPAGLVLTETDVALLDQGKASLWSDLTHLLASHPVIVVGSSLRDPSIVRLFRSIPSRVRGYVVLPDSDRSNDLRLSQWNLQVLHMSADRFFSQLDAAVRALTR